MEPDIVVFPGKVPQQDENAFFIKESELKKHLTNELSKIDGNGDKNATKTADNKKIITEANVNDDIQLKSAIDAIKILQLK